MPEDCLSLENTDSGNQISTNSTLLVLVGAVFRFKINSAWLVLAGGIIGFLAKLLLP